jgi:hypothetical protein
MCENNLIKNIDFEPINLNESKFIGKNGYTDKKYTLYHVSESGKHTTLLQNIPMEGIINYASIEPIENTNNIISGYRIIIGNQNI